MIDHNFRSENCDFIASNYTIVKWLILTSNTQATEEKLSFKLHMYSKGDWMP